MRSIKSALWGDVFDALDCGLIVLAADGAVVAWNDWMTSSTGVELADAAGKQLTQLPDALLHRLEAAFVDAVDVGASSLLTHSLHPVLLPLRTRAGRPLIHDLSVRPIGKKSNRYCLIQIFDVTVVSQRDQVLRARQNARYDAVVNNAPDAILTMDSHGTIQLANSAAEKVFGCASHDLLGRPIASFFDDESAWIAKWQATVSGERELRPAEFVARRIDGTATFLEVSASRWISDQRVLVSVILRDVNERRAAEAALRELNETLEMRVATTLEERKVLADIVENTEAFIQVVDLDYRLLAVNRASADEFQRVFGKRPKIGENVLDLLDDHPAEQTATRELWARALAGQAFTVIKDFGISAQNRRFYEHKFNALRDATGKQFAAFQFVYDVTARLEEQAQLARTEEALRQSQKMEAIGQLTGGIAHDFNNLLTGIIGAIDVVRRRLAVGRHDDIPRFMDAATASAERAAALTHRLLAFARRQPLDPKATDVNRLISGVEDFLIRTLGEQVQLAIELAPNLWPTLTDPNQLENSIFNLAINARDAMPDGGRLTISTENISVETPILLGSYKIESGEYVVIRLTDTGSGIDSETLSRVFEPFFTTKPIGQGTGLGLSMVYGFVKQTRGNVQIQKCARPGTSVSLYLRRFVGTRETQAVSTKLPAPLAEGEVVLLVEDDALIRLLIGEVLRDLGYACTEAMDAQAALPIIASDIRLDLMITDVGLPGMNGRRLAEIARQHRPDLKILFVTGYSEHITGSEESLAPGVALLTKPFSLGSLAFKIREILTSVAD